MISSKRQFIPRSRNIEIQEVSSINMSTKFVMNAHLHTIGYLDNVGGYQWTHVR